jgi:uncharacterized protein (TIGR03437 family)
MAAGKSLTIFVITILCALSVNAAPIQSTLPVTAQALLERARAANPQRYQFAIDRGAKIEGTADGRSFYLTWFPPATGQNNRTMIISLHGSTSWAFDEFYLWYDVALRHGHGLIALQWWLANDAAPNDYYGPDEVYRLVTPAILAAGIRPGRALLHGFSRGSANLYYVRMFDLIAKNNFFGLTLANSGGASIDYPFYLDVKAGKYGSSPFAGARFATFCGGQDPNPDRDGCPAMRRTADFIRQYGGSVDVTIEDATVGHGGFHQTAAHMEKMVTAFDTVLLGANTRWTIKPDSAFLISNANIPNVGLVRNEVWLTVGGSGIRLFRSVSGDNSTSPQTIPGLSTALNGTGYAPTETVPRESASGVRTLYVLGLAPPGSTGSVVFRLQENGAGQFTLSPPSNIYSGAGQFVGVPDVYTTPDGKLRLIHVDKAANRANAKVAISSNGGQSFTLEDENPFNDLNVTMPGASNTNVDPAVVRLSQGGYLAMAMRLKKLYLFLSADGKTFLPLNGGAPIEASTFRSGATGFFDPTLVQLGDGRVFMYVTLEQTGQAEAVGRAELIPNSVVASTSSASFVDQALAPESIGSSFGVGLAAGTTVATTTPLPFSLGGTSVRIRDSAGIERAAPLFFVSPGQINFQVPAGTASGEAAIAVQGSGPLATGSLMVQPTAPGIFTANANGVGVPAGTVLTYRNGVGIGSRPVFSLDPASGRYVAAPISLGAVGDEVYLVLYGSGWRNRTNLSAVTARIGSLDLQVLYAGEQGGFSGLDQINVRLTRDLIGRGEVELSLRVEGRTANPVMLLFGQN